MHNSAWEYTIQNLLLQHYLQHSMDKTNHLKKYAWDSSPHLLVTPAAADEVSLVLAEARPVQWVTLHDM